MISVNKIDDIIKLAESREKTYNSNNKSEFEKLDKSLENYLYNLTYDEVKSLQAIMYLGRDQDYDKNLSQQEIYNSQYEYFDKTIGWNSKELDINQMHEKLPLGAYLINAKEILGL